ncbi:MAG: T9SS type A sorting domain-containing protein [Bacteroidota bacterium]|nr:T9SS type A sorting domain-containing protein [Bacteroidota bacterium]
MKKLLILIFPLLLQITLFSQVTYTQGPKLNTARTSASGTKLNDGRILIAGGHGIGFLKLNSAEIWSPGTNTFQQYTMNDYRDFAGVVKLSNGRVMLIGGMSGDLGVGQLSSMEVFNPADNSFTSVCNLGFGARTMANGTELTSGKVLIAGCWWDANTALYGDIYDPVSNTCIATGQLTTARANPFLLPMNDGTALLMGGVNPYSGPTFESVELYDPSTNQFSLFQETFIPGETLWVPSYGRADEAATIRMKNGKYLMLAGKSSNDVGYYSLVTIDPATKSIALLHTSPEIPNYNVYTGDSVGVYSILLDTAKDYCYLICVKSTSAPYYETSFKVVDLKTNTLFSLNDHFVIPYGCWDIPRYVLNDSRIFFVGGSTSNNFDCLDSTFFYTVQVPTGVNDKNNLPNGYSLSQNYPNPFNPSTKIKFTLPGNEFVSLKVYDVVGREVSTIINEQKVAGNYEITFNASSLSSGVYFYKLSTKSYSESRKMILIK